MLYQGLDQYGNLVRAAVIVALGEHHEFTLAEADSKVAGSRITFILRKQYQLNIRTLGIFLQDISAIVGRMVVDHDYFYRGISLRQEGIHALSQEFSVVITGYDSAYEGRHAFFIREAAI